MACPSSTQPSNTAVTGLSNPSDDTATDGNRAMPRHHNGQPWRALLHNPAVPGSSLVQLTPQGLALIDRAVEAHVANEHRILSALKAADLGGAGPQAGAAAGGAGVSRGAVILRPAQ